MKKITISLFCFLVSLNIGFSQDCKDCNVLYCDGYTCDDGSTADGVMTSRKCGCGSEISGACAKVQIDLTGHPSYNPSLPSALKFTTQESGNFSIFFSDEFCTVSSCLEPDIEVSNSTNFEVPAGDVVYLTICKNGGNSGRRDMKFEYFPVQSNENGFCDDGFDNDLDNLVDCEDPDCVNSCEGTDSGSGGGLESNGRLGSKLSKRNYRMIKKGKSLFIPSDESTLNLRTNSTARNEHAVGNFSDFLPLQSLNGITVVESTPSGLNDVTNGDRIFAIDASIENDRIGSILMITTRRGVYEHTKPTCDRLMGYTLDKVFKKTYGDDSLITYKLTSKGRVPEYGVSFSARQTIPGKIKIENHWTLEQYPQGAYTNVQIWTSSEERLESWVTEILNNLKSYHEEVIINSSDAPTTFLRKGWIEDGQLLLELESNGEDQPVRISGSYSRTEIEESNNRFDFQYSFKGVNKITKSLEIQNFCDLGFRVSDDNGIGDDVYFADGQWGLDDSSPHTHIFQYDVTPSSDKAMNKLKLRRDVTLKGSTQDYVTLYRSLHPRFKAVDVSDFNGISFTANGSGSVEILIVKNSIKEWTHHYKTTVMLVDDEMSYEIPFHQFKSSEYTDPLVADDVVMVAFIIKSWNGEETEIEMSINSLSFSALELSNQLKKSPENQDLKAYPNPFSNHLDFQFESIAEEPFEMMLTNIHGHIILFEKGLSRPGINQFKINTQSYPEGMYFIHIKTIQGGNRIQKVYCQKF